MSITLKELQDERDVLKGDFETLSGRIKSVENELGQMKSNLNAVYGAIQQVDKLIKKSSPDKQEKQLLTEKQPMPVEKQQALNIATS
jgi:septal ring factor EnvC (AmiA/AmiB activator)|tara:strand:- start:17 stop:277 length:261 start_codon:yes stop_codon:yes gene_type:complete